MRRNFIIIAAWSAYATAGGLLVYCGERLIEGAFLVPNAIPVFTAIFGGIFFLVSVQQRRPLLGIATFIVSVGLSALIAWSVDWFFFR